MSRRIIVLPSLEELKELLGPSLLKDAHEVAPERLHLGRGYLGDPTVSVDKRARDLLELEISEDVGVDEDFGEFTRGDDELGTAWIEVGEWREEW